MYKVSVIVPVYNVESYIKKCAHSLFGQTLADVEYIFVDDCTVDKSMEVLNAVLMEYPERANHVKFIKHDRNRGLPAARATGIKYATGEYIIHSDSDDWMESTMLEKMYNAVICNDADLVYCDFNFIKQSGIERYSAPHPTESKLTTVNNWVKTKWTVLWNILAKHKIYKENNIKFPIGIKYCEDFYVGIQLLCHSAKTVHVAEALHNYNMLNQNSILHTESENNKNADASKVYSEILDFLDKENFFNICGQGVSWRFLDGMQYCVLDEKYFNKFKTSHPKTHRYIWSCPYLNKKVKMMMFCLDKNLDFLVKMYLIVRNFYKKMQ